ncbi:thioester domain-containing protein [Actinomadura hibisca]|uniref:thioester domain-containing protein n=1 Tax=Actinomadura hibisca TaxID=68565 RepID=UPI00082D74A4|nr:thioester domain-containing protein [Actinomadura hibisca]
MRTKIAALLAGLLAMVVCLTPVARAEPDPAIPTGPRDAPGFFTDAQITSLGSGLTVTGAYDGPDDMDPLTGYPSSLPAGSTPHGSTYAGTMVITDQGPSGKTAEAYCIDLNTDTRVGVNYKLGDWNSSHVPNLGYVGYILHNYFPTTNEPAGAADDRTRAAAVQLAIWFLTDKLVLAPSDPHYGLVSQIVADALANGPAKEPSTPELSVKPTTMRAPSTGDLVGPFTVSGDGPATIQLRGVEVFADAEGKKRLAEGDTVRPGDRLWVRSSSETDPQGFVLNRTVEIGESAVYLYDGTNPGMDTAQKLILAKTQQLTARAGARITRYDAGSLVIQKSVQGSGAGLQGQVTLRVTCTDPQGKVTRYTRTLKAGASGGRHSLRIGGIPTGSVCTVEETSAGDNGRVKVRSVVITPQRVTIPTDGTVTVRVTDTYDRATGGLQVTKTIAGTGAGRQGRVTIKVSCAYPSGGKLVREYNLSAKKRRGTYPVARISGLPTGTTCTVTEPDRGKNRKVRVKKVRIDPGTVTVTEDTTHAVRMTNTYGRIPGQVK